MFSNQLIRRMCTASSELELRLAPEDWSKVLNANREFVEGPTQWRGSSAWGQYLLDKLGLEAQGLSGANALEVCCGNGFLFFSLYELHSVPKHPCLVDLSEVQLSSFRKRCEQTAISIPHVVCADIGQLPISDNSVSLVYGHSFLHHLPDVGSYMREVYRVLCPGGRFIAFHEPTPTAPMLESFPAIWRHRNTTGLTDIWLISETCMRQCLSSAAFRDITIEPSSLISSITVIPLEKIWRRLKHKYPEWAPTFRKCCDAFERSCLPRRLRTKWAPSISISAYK